MNERIKPTIRRRIKDIEGCIYSHALPIRHIGIWETRDHVSARQASRQTFKPCRAGRQWGGPWPDHRTLG